MEDVQFDDSQKVLRVANSADKGLLGWMVKRGMTLKQAELVVVIIALLSLIISGSLWKQTRPEPSPREEAVGDSIITL